MAVRQVKMVVMNVTAKSLTAFLYGSVWSINWTVYDFHDRSTWDNITVKTVIFENKLRKFDHLNDYHGGGVFRLLRVLAKLVSDFYVVYESLKNFIECFSGTAAVQC